MPGLSEHDRDALEPNRARTTRAKSNKGASEKTKKPDKSAGTTAQGDWIIRRPRGRRIDMGPNVEA